MSYVFINGSTQAGTRNAACDIKAKLHTHFDREVLLVEDFMSETARGQAMFDEVSSPGVRATRAVVLILQQRKALLTQVILPAIKSGKSVIYIGGVLDDTRYVKNMEFRDILMANQEMLQAIGPHAFPVGAIYAKGTLDSSQNTSRPYFKQAESLMKDVPGLKLINYTHGHDTMIKINALFR